MFFYIFLMADIFKNRADIKIEISTNFTQFM